MWTVSHCCAYAKTQPEGPALFPTEPCFICLSSPPSPQSSHRTRELSINPYIPPRMPLSIWHQWKWNKRAGRLGGGSWNGQSGIENEEREREGISRPDCRGLNQCSGLLSFFPPPLAFFFPIFFLCLKWFTEEIKGLFLVLSWTQHQLPVRKARRKHSEQRPHTHTQIHTEIHTEEGLD